MQIERRLAELKITLPPLPTPLGTYVHAKLAGNMLYLAGKGPRNPDGSTPVGKLGGGFTVEQGYQHARSVGITLIAAMKDALGDLYRVEGVVKVLGMVNATADFTQQPEVINGFSDLMVEVFGERAGKGARSAVGMASLPGGIPVEVEAIFQVRG